MSGIQLHYGLLEVQQFEFSSQSLEYQEFVIAVLNCMQCQLNLVLVKLPEDAQDQSLRTHV